MFLDLNVSAGDIRAIFTERLGGRISELRYNELREEQGPGWPYDLPYSEAYATGTYWRFSDRDDIPRVGTPVREQMRAVMNELTAFTRTTPAFARTLSMLTQISACEIRQHWK